MLSTFLRFTGSQSSSPSTRRYGYTQLPLTPTSSPTQTRFPELEEQRSDDGDDVEDDPLLRARAPLPYLQLLILCLMRLAEPIAFTTIFPFANDQVASVLPDVPRSDIGYWTGAVESCFAVIQACVVLLWGRTSDRIGRKPVLLIGLAGVSISMCSFGMSKTYTGLILSRAIAGLCNGNIGVLKATVAEIMDGTEGKFSASAQARVFALIPFCYAMGSIIGPFIGASLSDPLGVLDQDSHIPKDDPRFLAQYPFFLPCATASALSMLSILLGACFLKETLPSRRARVLSDRPQMHGDRPPIVADVVTYRPPSIRSLLTKQTVAIMSSQMICNLLNISFAALLPLFCYTRVQDGGIQFSRAAIGNIMAANGVLSIIVQLSLLPILLKKIGSPLRMIRIVLPALVLVWLCFPAAHYEAAVSSTASVCGVLGLMIIFKTISNTSLVCITLLVNSNAPSRESLGAMNGLASTCSSIARAIGPASALSLFAYANSERGSRWMTWAAAICITIAGWLLSLRISPASQRNR